MPRKRHKPEEIVRSCASSMSWDRNDPPPMNSSTLRYVLGRQEDRNAAEASQALRDCREAAPGRCSRLCHVNLNWPREVSTTQFEFMRLSQLATSGKLLLGRCGACGGM
jgi:hypothetical protein